MATENTTRELAHDLFWVAASVVCVIGELRRHGVLPTDPMDQTGFAVHKLTGAVKRIGREMKDGAWLDEENAERVQKALDLIDIEATEREVPQRTS